MSEVQLKRLQLEIERLHEDEKRERIKASEACSKLIAFCNETEDPFVDFEANMNNPYLKKGRSGACSII